MTDVTRLLAAVDAAVVAHESRLRFGGHHIIRWPSDCPPPHVLAGRTFPPEVLERRLRQLGLVSSTDSGTMTIADELALLVRGDLPPAPGVAQLMAALRFDPAGSAERDRTIRRLDDVAAELGTPLTPPIAVPDSFARLQAVHAIGEPYFGRRRGRRPVWQVLRRAAKWGGETKRRSPAVSTLVLPHSDDPAVSLLLVVYGKYELARATLASLAESVDVPVETIIVDNASPDGAGARLAEEVRGAEFILRDDNLGYAAAINLAASRARAPHLAILNTDLDFVDGWLGSLVAELDADPDAGAATPLYLSEDGSIQDAGGILGPDAHGYSYGDAFAPGDGEVDFVRRIDYGTAAALVVRSDAFASIGGFDPVFGLGYFEDTDLGFAMRRRGFHSLYVPSSRVIHQNGGSFGHETPATASGEEPADLPYPLPR